MNITLLDLIEFLKKKVLFSLLILVISFSGYYGFSTFKTNLNVLTFEIDLREWENLNRSIFPWLDNYRNYPNEIKYGIATSFQSNSSCKNLEKVSSVLFCTVKGSPNIIEEQFSEFEKKTKLVLDRQLDQMKRDIRYFESRITRTKKFLSESSQALQDTNEIIKMIDYNYVAFNQIVEMEKDLLILQQVYQLFEPLKVIKNKITTQSKKNNIVFYSFMFSILCLFVYVLIGFTFQISNKTKENN